MCVGGCVSALVPQVCSGKIAIICCGAVTKRCTLMPLNTLRWRVKVTFTKCYSKFIECVSLYYLTRGGIFCTWTICCAYWAWSSVFVFFGLLGERAVVRQGAKKCSEIVEISCWSAYAMFRQHTYCNGNWYSDSDAALESARHGFHLAKAQSSDLEWRKETPRSWMTCCIAVNAFNLIANRIKSVASAWYAHFCVYF